MGDRNLFQQTGDDVGGMDVEYEQHEWVVAKSLLDVNDACSRTLEELLVHATRDEAEAVDPAELRRQLEDVINRHERVLDELELARDALADLERE